MQTRTVTLVLEKDTKNTYRYLEKETPGEAPILRQLYLQKWFTGNPAPKEIKVTVEVVE